MGSKIQISVLPRPKRALHQQYLPEAPSRRRAIAGPARGLYAGEPETCRRSLRPFLRNLAFLGLLLVVFKVYRIEERAYQGHAFQTLVTLAFLALPVHYLTPVPLQEAPLRRRLDGRFVLGLRRLHAARSCWALPRS